MNSLKQLENGLIASEDACRALQKKDSAKILVFSDSHGAAAVVSMILERTGGLCDAVIFCGDGIGDLLAWLDRNSADSAAREKIPPVLAFVAGNGDSRRYPVQFDCRLKPEDGWAPSVRIPQRQLLYACGHTVYIVHGNSQGVYYETETLEAEAEFAGADIAVYGHTHIAAEARRKIYLMNPGSCARPRRQTPPGFAVLELSGKNISTVFYRIDSGGGMPSRSFCSVGQGKDGQDTAFTPFFPDPKSLW